MSEFELALVEWSNGLPLWYYILSTIVGTGFTLVMVMSNLPNEFGLLENSEFENGELVKKKKHLGERVLTYIAFISLSITFGLVMAATMIVPLPGIIEGFGHEEENKVLEEHVNEQGDFVKSYGELNADVKGKEKGDSILIEVDGEKEKREINKVINGCDLESYMEKSDGEFIVCK